MSNDHLAELMQAALTAPEGLRFSALRLLKGETPPDNGPLLLTISEAARRLNLSRNTVRRIVKEGRLARVEIYTGSFRLRRLDVEALAAGRSR